MDGKQETQERIAVALERIAAAEEAVLAKWHEVREIDFEWREKENARNDRFLRIRETERMEIFRGRAEFSAYNGRSWWRKLLGLSPKHIR